MSEPAATSVPGAGLPLVRDFVNTAHFEADELLPDVPTTVQWLRHRGFEVALTPAQHQTLIETREHLRALFAANCGAPLPDRSTARLGHLLERASIRPVVTAEGVRLVPGSRGLEAFLAAIVAALVESTVDGTLRRMKVCRADDCWWSFYDRSKNGSGAWCSMRSCGARAKARAYRERQRDH